MTRIPRLGDYPMLPSRSMWWMCLLQKNHTVEPTAVDLMVSECACRDCWSGPVQARQKSTLHAHHAHDG